MDDLTETLHTMECEFDRWREEGFARVVAELVKADNLNDELIRRLIKLSGESLETFESLQVAVSGYRRAGRPMPFPLTTWCVDVLDPDNPLVRPTPRQGQRATDMLKNHYRDDLVVASFEILRREHGLGKTEAYKAIAKAAVMSPGAVRKVVARRKRAATMTPELWKAIREVEAEGSGLK